MKRSRRCKIVATLGPASNDEAMIEKLWRAGADLFRINMSHTDPAGMRERVAMICAVEAKVGRPIGILVDLQGPKLRVGAFENSGAELVKGQSFVLDSDEAHGDATRVRLPHPEILESLQPGHRMLIDDGRLRLDVVEATPHRALTKVEIGGRISNRKGVSLPDTEIPDASMTEKDRIDLVAAVETGVDWIALSFVQRAEDVKAVKQIAGGRALVLAKIEKPQAIAHLDEIMLAADGLMVARGDLGVEVPLEKVPGLQKRITREARRLGRPVIVATQMLESMITSPAPTRAEVSDVATAVFEGADAVMLSAEIGFGTISHRSRGDDEPHRRKRRAGNSLSQHHQRPAQRAGKDGRGCAGDGGARHGGNPGHESDRRLDRVGRDRVARRARTAARADPRADALPRHRATAHPGVGRRGGGDQGRPRRR